MQLPLGLREEEISLASYLRNRCQVNGTPKTLEELWSSFVPKVDHRRSCGYTVYVRLEKQERQGKMGVVAWVGVLVGWNSENPCH